MKDHLKRSLGRCVLAALALSLTSLPAGSREGPAAGESVPVLIGASLPPGSGRPSHSCVYGGSPGRPASRGSRHYELNS